MSSISGQALEWSKDRIHGRDAGSSISTGPCWWVPVAVEPSMGMVAWPLFGSLAAPGKTVSRRVQCLRQTGNQAAPSVEHPWTSGWGTQSHSAEKLPLHMPVEAESVSETYSVGRLTVIPPSPWSAVIWEKALYLTKNRKCPRKGLI